uniref:Cap-specific mRNA (nucleoside-2'-O-)-methyltransferase 2 n=1 Tax=Parascaris equorum TaxID=6256 RepID=A0A914RVN5_PAREQ
MFLDDELITNTQSKWLFGEDNSGNICKWTQHYLEHIVNSHRRFHLITADGSLYCQDDPSNQERIAYPLLETEMRISLLLLEHGGSMVIKIYTIFREETALAVLHLISRFEDAHLYKPSSSKPGNSEVFKCYANFSFFDH